MSASFVWMWLLGGAPVAVLSEVVRAENPRIARAGRICFGLVLAADLFFAAVLYSAGNSNADASLRATRSLWWVTIGVGGVPLALVSGLAVSRGYRGHRVPLAVIVLVTSALYLAFPLGFVPANKPLKGFGLFVHKHHALDVVGLLVPCLLVWLTELRWRRRPT